MKAYLSDNPRDELARSEELALPCSRFTLDNGLTLIVQEDYRAPRVATHLIYRVGAKDEPAGMHGFAHLFEHLMFSGSAHLPGSFVSQLERAGAVSLNGVTSADFTQYFQCVPLGALDFALFAESDRLGHFLDVLDQAKLDAQREVVIREMEEGDGQPLGSLQELLLRHLYPAEHPYAHRVIGRREDLAEASLDQAHAWFSRFYRPNNAVLTLVGAIAPEQALEKVQTWFGDILPGAPLERCQAWLPPPLRGRRVQCEDAVDAPLLRMSWLLPPFGHRDTLALQLLAQLFAGDWDSRLNRRLIRETGLAREVDAFVETGQLASTFHLRIQLRPEGSLASAEAEVRGLLHELIQAGPNPQELRRAQRLQLMASRNERERVLDMAALLGSSEVLLGDPQAHRRLLRQLLELTPDDLRTALGEWLADDGLVLQVLPYRAVWPTGRAADRQRPPAIIPGPPAALPRTEGFRLDNGLEVLLIPRPGQVEVSLSLLLRAGARHEAPGQAGLAQLVCGLIGAGGGTRSAEAFGEALRELGALIEHGIGVETAVLRLRALKSVFAPALQLFHEAVAQAWLDESAFLDLRERQLLAREEQPLFTQILPALILAADDPCAKPGFQDGSRHSLQRLGVDDARRFHRRHYGPQGARLLVAGDLQVDALRALLDAGPGRWQAEDPPAAPQPAQWPLRMGHLMLIDHPDAAISSISVAFAAPPLGGDQDAAVAMLQALLADSFASRLNLSLRETHRLAYGLASFHRELPGRRLIGFEFQVANAQVALAVAQVRDELQALLGDRPLLADELDALRQGELLRLNLAGQGSDDLGGYFEGLLSADLPLDYHARLAKSLAEVSCAQVQRLAQTLLSRPNSVWLVAGNIAGVAECLDLPVRVAPDDLDALYDCAAH